jgi:hypothetical protein
LLGETKVPNAYAFGTLLFRFSLFTLPPLGRFPIDRLQSKLSPVFSGRRHVSPPLHLITRQRVFSCGLWEKFIALFALM